MPNWTLKADEKGGLVLQDGRPVYVDEASGQEAALDVNQLHDKILQLTKESKARRLEAEQASTRLKEITTKLPEVEDLDTWLADAAKAVETVQNLDGDKLVAAEKVERLKAEWQSAFEDKEKKSKAKYEATLADLQGVTARKDAQIRQLVVSNRFATCDLFAGPNPRTVLPPDIAEAKFGNHFRVEETKDNGLKLVAYDQNGEVIQSRERPGEEAAFEEAIQILFDRHPDRERLLRNPGGSGSGSTGGATGVRPKDELSAMMAQLDNPETDMRTRISLKRRIAALQMARKAK